MHTYIKRPQQNWIDTSSSRLPDITYIPHNENSGKARPFSFNTQKNSNNLQSQFNFVINYNFRTFDDCSSQYSINGDFNRRWHSDFL